MPVSRKRAGLMTFMMSMILPGCVVVNPMDDDADAYLRFPSGQPTSYSVASDGDVLRLKFTAMTEWKVSAASPWLVVDPAEGMTGDFTMNVGIEKNVSEADRDGTLTIVADRFSQVFDIHQEGFVYSLDLSPSTLSFSEKEEEGVLRLKAHGMWSVTSTGAWCTATPDSGDSAEQDVVIRTTRNMEDKRRTCELVFKVGGVTKSVSVTQDPAGTILDVSSETLDFPCETGSSSVRVSSTSGWTAQSDAEWCSVNPASGSGNQEALTVFVQANDDIQARTCHIRVDNGLNSRTITVSQAPPVIQMEFSPSTLSFSCNDASDISKLSSSVRWTAQSDADWCTVIPASGGSGTHNLFISVKRNEAHSSRSCHVTVIAGDKKSTLTVSQEAGAETLRVESGSLEFGHESESVSIGVYSNTDWTVSSSESWCKVSPTSGDGDKEITVSVSKNAGLSARSAEIMVRTGDAAKMIPITVSQKGAPEEISLSVSTVNAPKAGSVCQLTVHSNAEWEVMGGEEWVDLSETTGNGNRNITLTIHENEWTNTRSMDLVFVTEDRNGMAVLSISQEAALPFLEAGGPEVAVSWEGEAHTIPVRANVHWTAGSSESWCIISPSEGFGGGDLEIDCLENEDIYRREAYVTLRSTDPVMEVSVKVVQSPTPVYISASDESPEFDSTESSVRLEVFSNSTWQLEEGSASWIKVGKTKDGKGVDIHVDKNPANTVRTGSVRLKTDVGEVTCEIRVTQKGLSGNEGFDSGEEINW